MTDRYERRYVSADDTTWPLALDLEWRLRYAAEDLTREDHLVVASIVSAYSYLVDPTLTHGDAVSALRRARKAHGRD